MFYKLYFHLILFNNPREKKKIGGLVKKFFFLVSSVEASENMPSIPNLNKKNCYTTNGIKDFLEKVKIKKIKIKVIIFCSLKRCEHLKNFIV